MPPRSFKKLGLLVIVILLTIWAFIFNFYIQPVSVDDEQDTKDSQNNHQKAAMKLHRILERSQSMTRNQSRKFRIKIPSQIQESDFQNMDSSVAQDLLSRIKIDCRDSICSEFVTKADKPHFDYCIKKTWKAHARYREPRDSVCRFMNGAGRDPIALASFPGSGNTWVRGLIQGVTGLCTGAIYCDRMLRRTGFPGESIRSGIVLVVKTHHYDPRWTGVYYAKSAPFSYFKKVEHIPVYNSAIFLLRNPFDSLVSEYSRQLREEEPDSHVSVPKREYFGTNLTWNNFVHEQAIIWEQTVLTWIISNHNHSVLIVKYEDIINNTESELRRMLDFLQVPYSSSRLKEVVTRGYKKYRREHSEMFEHYTTGQRDTVRSTIERVSKCLKESGLLEKGNVTLYLQP